MSNELSFEEIREFVEDGHGDLLVFFEDRCYNVEDLDCCDCCGKPVESHVSLSDDGICVDCDVEDSYVDDVNFEWRTSRGC